MNESTVSRLSTVIHPSSFVWGLVSQGASSLTNFGLSLVAAREVGPEGLGLVFIGFAAYLVALGLQRALIIDPLMSTTSAMAEAERSEATRSALLISILLASFLALVFGLIRLGLSSDIGRGLVLFVPWIVPALLQDFWRTVLYRDDRSKRGALNDLLWLAAMVIGLPLALNAQSSWVIVTWWGSGALAAMVAGFFQTGLWPARPASAVRWWTAEAWPFGRWLLTGTAVYSAGSHLFIFLLALIIGAAGVGGLRAAQVVFAPLTLLGPALALPGLPAVSRREAVSRDQAKKLAVRLSGVALLLTGAYVLIAMMGSERILSVAFGRSFERFHEVVLPVGVQQILIAPTLGLNLLIIAQRRGKALLFIQGVVAVVTLSLGLALAKTHGVLGAAWGMAIASAVGSMTFVVVALELRFGRVLGGTAHLLKRMRRIRHGRISRPGA